ncbi:MAG: hypothetical protein E7589_03590 [Ruminococcaceae bacterium]|nr:hypothetical protein [Oscillospiraceae bacterium]
MAKCKLCKSGVKPSARRCEYDAEGRAVISMTVKDDSDFLSVYSQRETPFISSDVAEFIENSSHSLRPGQSLTLRIHSDCIDDGERQDYREGIQEYYSEKYIAAKRELRFNLFAVIMLALAGIATLVLAFGVDNHIWSEVIDIAAWVFLWEAVDIGVFKLREINLNRRRYLSYISMKVEYLPLSHTEKP